MLVNANPQAKITRFHILTKIQLRYAVTQMETTIKNFHNETTEVVYDMYVPHEAFVSNFSMTLNQETYVAKVDLKDNASDTFKQSEFTSGLVENNVEFKEGKRVS